MSEENIRKMMQFIQVFNELIVATLWRQLYNLDFKGYEFVIFARPVRFLKPDRSL